jgi:hypothetical protein
VGDQARADASPGAGAEVEDMDRRERLEAGRHPRAGRESGRERHERQGEREGAPRLDHGSLPASELSRESGAVVPVSVGIRLRFRPFSDEAVRGGHLSTLPTLAFQKRPTHIDLPAFSGGEFTKPFSLPLLGDAFFNTSDSIWRRTMLTLPHPPRRPSPAEWPAPPPAFPFRLLNQSQHLGECKARSKHFPTPLFGRIVNIHLIIKHPGVRSPLDAL